MASDEIKLSLDKIVNKLEEVKKISTHLLAENIILKSKIENLTTVLHSLYEYNYKKYLDKKNEEINTTAEGKDYLRSIYVDSIKKGLEYENKLKTVVQKLSKKIQKRAK